MPKLTKTIIDALQPPAKGDLSIWDTELESFGVRVMATGRRTYVIRYRNAEGVQRKLTLARCSDMPPDRARDLARKKFAEIAEGKDPAAEKAATRAAQRQPKEKPTNTVEALFKGYVAWMRGEGKVSVKEVERTLLTSKRYAAADALCRDRPAAEVTPEDVIEYVSSYYKRDRRGLADKARSYIASAYAWGIQSAHDYTVHHRQQWGITSNPAAVLKKDSGATKERDRNLPFPEIKLLWEATLGEEPEFTHGVGACIRVLIGCGQRVEETLRLEGRELDFEDRLWKMPAEKTKGGKRPHTIPLPAIVIPTLKELVELYGDGPLFPGRPGRKNERMDHRTISHAIRAWVTRDDAKVEAFQTRDLRRTWKSRTGEVGIDRFTRDLIQQHAKHDTGSRHYDRASYIAQMREAMDRWSSCLGIVLSGGTPPAYGEPLMKIA